MAEISLFTYFFIDLCARIVFGVLLLCVIWIADRFEKISKVSNDFEKARKKQTDVIFNRVLKES